MLPEDIKRIIENGIPGAHVEVDGDGTHFGALIVSDVFSGKTLIQRHRLVYSVLGGKMGTDIHALSMQTYTPEQWQKKKDLRVV